jgi:hypothetical protein
MSSIFDNAGSALAAIAPTIAGLFGGPLASQGVTALEGVFGLTPSAATTGAQRQAAINAAFANATPEQIIALKQADNDLNEKYLTAGVQIETLKYTDTTSARTMQATTKSQLPAALAILITVGAAVVCWAVLTGHTASLDGAAGLSIGTVIGAVISEMKQVTGFYFGSSSASGDNNALISKALDSTPPTIN